MRLERKKEISIAEAIEVLMFPFENIFALSPSSAPRILKREPFPVLAFIVAASMREMENTHAKCAFKPRDGYSYVRKNTQVKNYHRAADSCNIVHCIDDFVEACIEAPDCTIEMHLCLETSMLIHSL